MTINYAARVLGTIERGTDEQGRRLGPHLRVGAFRGEAGREEQVGEYRRNHARLMDTFCPFRLGGRDYAVLSPDYTTTLILELPSCRDLGGEEPHTWGFCPVEYYVPAPAQNAGSSPVDSYPFGFVAGCYWGWPYRVQFLDLARAAEGILVRDERTGYIPMLTGRTLPEYVDCSEYDPPAEPVIRFLTSTRFNVLTGERLPGVEWSDYAADLAWYKRKRTASEAVRKPSSLPADLDETR